MIINSLLDTDLYKYTMMQWVFHHYPTVDVEYHFTCRTPGIDLSPYAERIQQEINAFCDRVLQADELDYLAHLPYIKPDFIAYLKTFRLSKNHIQIVTRPQFDIVIKGPWLATILFEVPVLAIVSEIYHGDQPVLSPYETALHKLSNKIQLVLTKTPIQEFEFIEFGTRRRFSFSLQKILLEELKSKLPNNLIGTSNVFFAKQLQLTPMGTMAHEYIQAFQSLAPELRMSQVMAFKAWLDEYHNELGIVLSDTFNQAIFFSDFSAELARAYKGVRQDSGDPFEWGEHLISHYQSLGIDPRTKSIVFSDALTFDLAIALFKRFHHRIHTVFGIGTHLTNDVGIEPIQIIIKMTHCQGKPVAKLSDSPSKSMLHDKSYVEILKKVFKA